MAKTENIFGKLGGGKVYTEDIAQADTSASKNFHCSINFTPKFAGIFKETVGLSNQSAAFYIAENSGNYIQIIGSSTYEVSIGTSGNSAPSVQSVSSSDVHFQLGAAAVGYNGNWRIVITG